MPNFRATVSLLIAVGLTFALVVSGTASASASGPEATAAKKCKRHKSKRHKKKCKRKHGATGTQPTSPGGGAGSQGPQAPVRTSEEQLLLSRGHWWEYDYDNDGICYLYGFSEVTGGNLAGSRTAYFDNPFTGVCNTTPQGPTAGFNWSASGGLLQNHYVGGFTELIALGQLTSDEFLQIARASTGVSGWWSCRSPNFYLAFYSC